MKKSTKETKKTTEGIANDVTGDTKECITVDCSPNGTNNDLIREIREEIPTMNISFMKAVIQQVPSPENGYVAIIQTTLVADGKKVSMPGFASLDPNEIDTLDESLYTALYRSTDMARGAIQAITDSELFFEPRRHCLTPKRFNGPPSRPQIIAARAIIENDCGKPIANCSKADLQKRSELLDNED